jgi:hypothetical protein
MKPFIKEALSNRPNHESSPNQDESVTECKQATCPCKSTSLTRTISTLSAGRRRRAYAYPSGRTVNDSRGSLLLLVIDVVKGFHHHLGMFVCEPLTQRMVKVGTGTATACPPQRGAEAFLLQGPEPGGNGLGMSNFRAVRLSRNGSVASIFTSGGSCCKVRTGNDNQGKEMRCNGSAMDWHADGGRAVLTMDQSTAEFSSSSLPDIADFLSELSPPCLRDGKMAAPPAGCWREAYGHGSCPLKRWARCRSWRHGGR